MIARLPQLDRLDGKEITRTDRIKAQQRLPALLEEITPLAEEVCSAAGLQNPGLSFLAITPIFGYFSLLSVVAR